MGLKDGLTQLSARLQEAMHPHPTAEMMVFLHAGLEGGLPGVTDATKVRHVGVYGEKEIATLATPRYRDRDRELIHEIQRTIATNNVRFHMYTTRADGRQEVEEEMGTFPWSPIYEPGYHDLS